MTIKLKYFGMLLDTTKVAEQQWDIPENTTVAEIRKMFLSKYRDSRSYKFQVAVNSQIADDSTVITSDCEIALLPPFAGG